MAYYKPCKNCAVDKSACPRRAEVSAAISGLSVTVVNFRCASRQPMFRSGQRVAFDWTYWDVCEDEDFGLGLIYHGTVIEEYGLRFIVRVDDGPSADINEVAARETFKSDNLVIKVRPAAMRALDEADRVLCPHCSAYEGEQGRCQGWGHGYDSYWPNGCFSKPLASEPAEVPF
jgi:hypothetical protein